VARREFRSSSLSGRDVLKRLLAAPWRNVYFHGAL